MDRRTACGALALAWMPMGPAAAQRRTAKVAWVSVEREDPALPSLVAFKEGMRRLGHVEGTNLVVETWWGDLSNDRLRARVPAIVASKPDVIVAQNSTALRPLIDAGVTIPTVFTFSGDPVVGKVVDSYARPGHNRTGLTFFSSELVPKRLELMREMLPRMRRVAVLAWSRHPGELEEYDAAKQATRRMGLEHRYFPVGTPDELDAAFDGMAAWRPDAILAFADSISIGQGDRIAAFATKKKIPAVSGWPIFAEKGNLMSYGPTPVDALGQLATYVDKILKGANAGELPIDRPTRIELVINLRAAAGLGVPVPPALLARADRVIR